MYGCVLRIQYVHYCMMVIARAYTPYCIKICLSLHELNIALSRPLGEAMFSEALRQDSNQFETLMRFNRATIML